MGLGISGSTVKSWFQYRCERKTRYEIMDAADRAAVPVVEDERERPWADFGIEYEKRILIRLAACTRVLRPAVGEEGLSERQAAAFLRGAKDAEYAAQVNLRPDGRPAFLRDLPNVKLRRTYADLVRYDGTGPVPVFRVIDIKATRRATAFHKAQVAFYARMLQAMLAELRAPGQVDPTASIWHIPENGQARATPGMRTTSRSPPTCG